MKETPEQQTEKEPSKEDKDKVLFSIFLVLRL